MSAKEFLETKPLKLKDPLEGYVIPYSYLCSLLEEYAKETAIGFLHYTEWKMEDDDWLDKKGKLKPLDRVYREFIKKLSV